MTEFALPETDLSPALARLLDQRCDRFEAEWKLGRTPRLEDFLGGVAGADRANLLGELLAVELAYRSRAGNPASPAEYEKRFPGQQQCVRNAFADFMPPGSYPSPSPPKPPVRYPAWIIALALVAVVFLGLAVAGFLAWVINSGNNAASASTQAGTPLSGELLVTVSNASGTKRRLRIDEPGALPVRNGDMIHLEARLSQPAYLYVLLLDGEGKTQPLYPWDPAKGFSVPAPQGEPRKVLDVPPERDRGWVTDGSSGLDTVLLLARRTPLPADVDLPRLIGKLPPAPLPSAFEPTWLSVDAAGGIERGAHRGPELERELIQQPLFDLLDRLRPHFEMVRAVRYAHQGD